MTSGPPTERRRRAPLWRWLLLGGFVIAVLAVRLLAAALSPPVLPELGRVPLFELTDQTGSPFGADELSGRVWIASFIYTTCPGPCPRVVQSVSEVQRRIGNEPGLSIVSISVDPAADTPAALGVYGSARGIDPERWKLLTGTVDNIVELVRGGFLLAVARADDVASDARISEGPVVHSVHLVLVDGAMRIRGYYDSTDPEALDRLVEDTRRLLRDGAS